MRKNAIVFLFLFAAIARADVMPVLPGGCHYGDTTVVAGTPPTYWACTAPNTWTQVGGAPFFKQTLTTAGVTIEEMTGTDQLQLWHDGTRGQISSIGGLAFPTGNVGVGSNPNATYRLNIEGPGGGADASMRLFNPAATGDASVVITTGDGTTSARRAYFSLIASETVPIVWRVGMVGTQSFLVRNNTAARNDLTITSAGAATFAGAVTVTGTTTFNGQLDLNDPGAKPTCDSTTRGQLWYDEGGAGVADTFEVCIKSSGGTYSWKSVLVE